MNQSRTCLGDEEEAAASFADDSALPGEGADEEEAGTRAGLIESFGDAEHAQQKQERTKRKRMMHRGKKNWTLRLKIEMMKKRWKKGKTKWTVFLQSKKQTGG